MSGSSTSKINEHQAQYNENRKRKREASKTPRYLFEISVPDGDDDRLTRIKERLRNVKDVMCIDGKMSKTQNADVIESLLLAFETLHNSSPNPPTTSETTVSCSTPHHRIEVHTPCEEDDQIFACSYKAISSLVSSVIENRAHCTCSKPWNLSSQDFTRYGHAICFTMKCSNDHLIKWYSSPILNGKYYVNCRMIHAFISCGLLETQYKSFTKAALLGFVEKTAIKRVFHDMGYFEAVNVKAKHSMKMASLEEKSTPFCEAHNGVAIMTDSRHDSISNAFHSTITGIGFESKKILHLVNISRTAISSAQSREFHGTTKLIEELKSSVHGIEVNVIEVGHDFTIQLKKWFDDKGIKNSFDTWHGTKHVKKAISKIAKGAQRQEGVTWFNELSDKVASIKTGFYYAMKNNDGTPEDLQK